MKYLLLHLVIACCFTVHAINPPARKTTARYELHVACVIDLTYNGSFSFQPNNIICDPKGRNALVLFTKDKKVYFLDEQTFAKTEKSTLKVNFRMTEVTDSIKTPEDLKKLLGI